MNDSPGKPPRLSRCRREALKSAAAVIERIASADYDEAASHAAVLKQTCDDMQMAAAAKFRVQQREEEAE